MSPFVLSLLQYGLPYWVETDARNYQIVEVLFLAQSTVERKPVRFWSRTLQKEDKIYFAT